MHVAQVGRFRLILAGAAQEILHCRHLPGSRATRDVDVVTVLGVLYPQTKFERLDGTFLPDDPIERIKIGGRFKGELLRVARTTKLIAIQFIDHIVVLRVRFYRRCVNKCNVEPFANGSCYSLSWWRSG